MKTTTFSFAGLAAITLGATLSAASTCNIGFNDPSSLLIIPNMAKDMFAAFPFYIQGCGNGWVHVTENDRARYGKAWGSNYGHYHLAYERGAYCLTSNWQSGIMSGSNCVAVVDPQHERRYFGSHWGDQWIRVYTYNEGQPEMVFSLKEIKVKDGDITLYFHRSTGQWMVWNRLPPGWWNLSEAASIKEILIRGADVSVPYHFDDIVVSVP